jgi:membrane-bound lytic murein transglycosylase D
LNEGLLRLEMRHYFFIILIAAAIIVCLSPQNPAMASSMQAPDPQRAEVRRIVQTAESHYQRGQEAYMAAQYDRARREFDQAVDNVLISSIDVRSDDELRIYYRELIEKINRYQIAAIEEKDGGFSVQLHEPSPLDKIASLSDADLEEAGSRDEDVAGSGFNFNFTAAAPVKQFIGYFSRGRGRGTIEAGILRSGRYRDMARRIFREEGVPTDLIWLAQVESGWNPYALSSAEAKGIWQFVPSTGARFGLSQNYWVDERSDPEKSTRAAARYLKWLSNRYHGNWELALAAYNAGEGSVDSAIARSGSRDFWYLHRTNYLPHETRNYVPAILAVVAMAKDPGKFGLQVPPAYSYHYATHTISKQTDLRTLARKLKVDYSTLLDMNPELQRGMTPPGKHVVRVPMAAVGRDSAAPVENPASAASADPTPPAK